MSEAPDPNQQVTITLERWRWEQIHLCLERYVAFLRGEVDDTSAIWDDVEWANQLDAMADEFRELVSAGGDGVKARDVSPGSTPRQLNPAGRSGNIAL